VYLYLVRSFPEEKKGIQDVFRALRAGLPCTTEEVKARLSHVVPWNAVDAAFDFDAAMERRYESALITQPAPRVPPPATFAPPVIHQDQDQAILLLVNMKRGTKRKSQW